MFFFLLLGLSEATHLYHLYHVCMHWGMQHTVRMSAPTRQVIRLPFRETIQQTCENLPLIIHLSLGIETRPKATNLANNSKE